MMPLRSAAMTTTPATSLRATALRIASSMVEDDWGCWALAANGKAATPPTSVMNSRRFIGSSSPLAPQAQSRGLKPSRYHGDTPRSTTLAHWRRKNLARRKNLHGLVAHSRRPILLGSSPRRIFDLVDPTHAEIRTDSFYPGPPPPGPPSPPSPPL